MPHGPVGRGLRLQRGAEAGEANAKLCSTRPGRGLDQGARPRVTRLGAAARRMLAVGVCGWLATGCGRAGSVPVAPVPRPPLVTVADAQTVVRVYFADLRRGHPHAAYALWSAAWRSTHPYGPWRAGPPLPAGAQVRFRATKGGHGANGAHVAVQAVVTQGGLTRWAAGTFTVGVVAGRAVLTGGGLQAAPAVQNLQALATRDGHNAQSGAATCGAFRVRWSVRFGVTAGGGARSHVRVATAAGAPVSLPALPAFSFGTLPTYCGDLLGTGGMDLVLTTATTTAGDYHQAAVLSLGASGARLIGQVPSVGTPSLPRPEAVGGLVPLAIEATRLVDVVGGASVLAPEFWGASGGSYALDSAAFPAALAADAARRLSRARASTHCTRGWKACVGARLLRAYADDVSAGTGPARLPGLLALAPPQDAAWLRGQAGFVAVAVRRPL